MKKLLSVIVPVYKIEENLFRKCIDSLVIIENEDVEIILVDDGSPDNCGEICDEYAARDSRVRVLHKENAGVSSARNDGIRMAQGQYIMFVDADDWVDIKQVCSFITADDCQDVDVFFWGTKYIFSNGTEDDRLPFSVDKFFSSREEIEKLQLMTFGRGFGTLKRSKNSECMASVNNKAIKTKLIRENGIYFDDAIPFGEDGLFALELFGVSEKCRYIRATPYHYFQRDSSACHCYKANADDEVLRVFNATKNYLDRINASEEYYVALFHRCFDWMGWWISSVHIEDEDDLRTMKKRLKEEPFRSVVCSVKLKNFDLKGKIKVILFGLGLIRMYLWLK